jgi:nucleoside-diphosphate-sugar epimerase
MVFCYNIQSKSILNQREINETMAKKSVLITGGAGFIGSHISDIFTQQGYYVRVIDNLSSGNLDNIGNADFVKGDIRDIGFVKKFMGDIDYVIHNAAAISVPESNERPELYNEINVNGMVNVLIAAKEAKVKKVVFASSAAVYGNAKVPIKENVKPEPLSIYAGNKTVGEEYLKIFKRCYGLDYVILRYFNVFGPRQNLNSAYAAVIPIFIDSFLNNKKATVFGDGKQTRDFIYVKNVALANLMAIENDEATGKTLNIASGKRISINRLIKTISPGIETVHADPRVGDIKHSSADVSLSRKVLGKYDKYSFEAGIKETIEWYKKSMKTS